MLLHRYCWNFFLLFPLVFSKEQAKIQGHTSNVRDLESKAPAPVFFQYQTSIVITVEFSLGAHVVRARISITKSFRHVISDVRRERQHCC